MGCHPNNDLLQSFIATCYSYLTTQLKIADKSLYVLRKQVYKLSSSGDFSFSQVKISEQNLSLSLSDLDTVMEKISACSQQWSLQVNKVAKVENVDDRRAIFLDRSLAFKEILKATLDRGHSNGQHLLKDETVLLTTNYGADKDNLDLSNYRVLLLKKFAYNALSTLGYKVESLMANHIDKPIEFHIYSETHKCSTDLLAECKRLPCGAVCNARHRSKECKITAADYFQLRLKDMEVISEHKYGNKVKLELGWDGLLSNLSDAAVKMDLLGTKPNRTVVLNLEPKCTSSRTTRHKGAAFVLYNCARISEIMKQFEKKVSDGIYPPLVPIDTVDFSLLSTEEEWHLLFNYILVYPSIIQESCDLSQGILRPERVCDFLLGMCNSFSSYYRRVRVLTEPRSHMLPQMYARLYLLQSILQTLHNALRLLDIAPVSQM